MQQFPHRFHASVAFLTLAVELAVVWMMFLPRRFRIVCFWIVALFEIGIILTANYTFLNYLALALGFLLLDDRFFERILPHWLRDLVKQRLAPLRARKEQPESWCALRRRRLTPVRVIVAGAFLGIISYTTTAELVWMLVPRLPLP